MSPILSIAIQVLAIGGIFYWLIIKPQRDERKRHQALIAGLKKGDEVSTVGGIIGTIVHVEEDRVTLKTADATRLVIERQKISRMDVPGSAS